MQINCLWTGLEYQSIENCLVTTSDSGTAVVSTIVGYYEGKIYKVDYVIRTNKHWETLYLSICSRHSDVVQTTVLESDGNGNWLVDGMETDRFAGCTDIDISLTPFTNTLPVNRLKLELGQHREIAVIYLDVLRNEMRPARQLYTKLSPAMYRYENIPNDFQSDISVDELGLVTGYPSLFVRTAGLKSSYTDIKS